MLYGRSKLEGVKPDLIRVVERAAEVCTFDVLVTEGVRTKERQASLYAQGRTAPGKKVTWTMNSKHITGDAVDVVPYVDKKIDWDDVILFVTLGEAMLAAAKELSVLIRWGYDWDGDGILKEKGEYDGPHYEIV